MQKASRHTKDVLKYSAVYKKRQKVKNVKRVIFGIVVLLTIVGLIFISRTATFAISEIQVKGLQSVSTQDVIAEVDSQVNGSYALVFPKKNILFYPKERIREDLLKKFGAFEDIQIRTIDTNKLEVSVVEKNAVAVSCKTEQSVVSGAFTDCFFIDSNIRAFQRVVGEPDQSLTRFIDYNTNSTSTTFSSTTLDQLEKIRQNLVSKNLITQYVLISDSKDVEFKIVNNGKIKISLPVGENFLSVLNTALGTKQLSGNVLFEYIDARFGNKVFLKLGNTANVMSAIGIISVVGSSSTSTISSTLSNTTSSGASLVVKMKPKTKISTSTKTRSSTSTSIVVNKAKTVVKKKTQ